jgi:hypothetical protein
LHILLNPRAFHLGAGLPKEEPVES